MSFSSDVKAELAKHMSKHRHCQLAELAAFLELEGDIEENPLLIQKYALLMKRIFTIDVSEELSDVDLKWMKLTISEARKTNNLLKKDCCKRAYLRGAFLSTGSMSNPEKGYHLEIVCKEEERAKEIKQLAKDFEAEPKIIERKGHYVVYWKEGSQIVDMLNVMEAYVALMNFENVRILKEMRNSVNRKVNCETANINKTVNAAVKQIEDITLIQEKIGLDELPVHLQEMAYVRLQYPDAPLKELGDYLDPPVGKSGVNHRLRKIAEIAEDLK